jgi:sugar lactone lactonase YvrE
MVAWAELLKDAKEIPHEFVGDGLMFGEGPRYSSSDKSLYVSDMVGAKIYRVDESSGHIEIAIDVPGQPNGIAFHPDGSLIYSSMFDKKLLRYDLATRKSTEFADLSPLMKGYNGDMVIDNRGRVYVDDVGARVLHGEPPAPGRLLIVDPDGKLKCGPENLQFPNGIAIDSTGKRFILAETWGKRLSQFDISRDGQLTNQQPIWDVSEVTPAIKLNGFDGICMDAEDGVWCSMLDRHAFVRRSKEGKITNYVKVDGHATACTLGGSDGNTLFLITNKFDGGTIFEAMMEKRTKCTISKARVEIGKGKALP